MKAPDQPRNRLLNGRTTQEIEFFSGVITTVPSSHGLRYDEVGYWTEVKLDIIRKYAAAYSVILARSGFWHAYVDGFAGPGIHIARDTSEYIAGSPLNALRISPPFRQHYLIDLDGTRVDHLRAHPEVSGRPDVQVIHGDCNRVLLDQVFPQIAYENRRRALCVLDPYGLHLNWDVMARAGQMRSIELFINFPIMDMNRNVLWRKPDQTTPEARARMTAYWGDDSWRQLAYRTQADLFGETEDVKRDNHQVAEAFRRRLVEVAGFRHVPNPMPMRNTNSAVVYYLFFASQRPVAEKIVRQIFEKYRSRRY
jgi:three-Cys-motif partner protein